MNVAHEVRRGRKFDQVLEGARQIFMRDGFEGASVDDIATAANVSKATLYSYFPDKRLLFMEVARCECATQADKASVEISVEAGARAVLTYVGEKIWGFTSSEMGLKMFRICVAESGRFPELGQAFYESGPEVMVARLSEYFEEAESRGELSIPDKRLAVFQFSDMCKSDLWLQMVLGVRTEVAPDERRRLIDSAVDVFLARYGV
ncbi:TetR/AcrR family transcriptional regulator [Donghicola mangrovi]|uniref:TetR/AcrR family transcriptional regulator n=1 Tax=Donghicola mangrovi TaxID=2729614 RepID=A0A850PZE7_9RHOB|nr:TetR/AcrR family transcriptional regulator [Donghicola mangrovi]NVO22114.1 TetR/AcrR family transcriptional regulator [Donghicola mangrovi]